MSQISHYPLSGVHVIEASAGTGKTYTISSLFLRLLLEKGLSIRQILVVTYTRAATEDLRVRVRQMLQDCLHAFESGEGADAFLCDLLEKVSDHSQAMRHLVHCLHNFDEAGIFTIHGFCQRMLKENCLESGALFDTELVPDLDDLLHEIAADFWRMQTGKFSSSFIAFSRKKLHPDRLFSLLKQVRPGQRLLPAVDGQLLEQIANDNLLSNVEQELATALEKMYGTWPGVKEQVSALFLDSTDLKKTSYKPENRRVRLAQTDDFCLTGAAGAGDIFDNFRKFTADSLAKGTKKGGVVPVHPFFDLCQEVYDRYAKLQDLFRHCLIGLQQQAAHYGATEFVRRKTVRNVYAYDDLLLRLQEALAGVDGKKLARLIGKRYPAALIDEFQDTDPVQYDIFSTVYGNGAGKLLYIIGDPKQAIYSFRGADIFAYLRAVKGVDSPFTLSDNYRSEPSLITAVNTLFSSGQNPFVYEDISFSVVSAGEIPRRKILTIDGASEAPFQLRQIRRKEGDPPDKLLSKPEAEKRILVDLAREISQLLSLGQDKKAMIDNRPLGPRDIAVLVRENRQARLVMQALSQVGVDSVQQGTESIFVSHEASELARVLGAVAEPANEVKLRTALATDMLGGSCRVLMELEQDEEGWGRLFERFLLYHDLWREKGFMAMLSQLLRKENVRGQLLRFADGERRLTNVLHLGEVLHRYESEGRLSLSALRIRLDEMMAGKEQGGEEHQLRLESDGERVQVVTIHRSKGLQYPVVFCPFSWPGARSVQDVFSFHLPDEDNCCALDLGSEEKLRDSYKELAAREELAEMARLLYVALTRAVHRCYLYWGPFSRAESSALAWLLHGRGDLLELKKRFKKMSDADIGASLQELCEKAKGAIALSHPEDEPVLRRSREGGGSDLLVCREFVGDIDAGGYVTSFSAISKESHGQGAVVSYPDSSRADSIYAFPKGAGPGIFMHEIFEHLDFTLMEHEPQRCRELVAAKLAHYGFEEKWLEPVLQMVKDVLSVNLLADGTGPVLKTISNDQRLNELEFYFPLSAVSVKAVQEVFQSDKNLAPLASTLSFSVIQGYLKGFMDLVFEDKGRFYLVDWKSNYLGPALSDYQGDKLYQVMVREKYILQYLFYTVALHCYLGQRIADYDYDKHFGGLFYVFLRGVRGRRGAEYGIYHDRPKLKLIEQLGSLLVAQS